jgi:Uma2 family endonuclease
MSLPEPSLLSPEEYLDIERKSEIRSEYIAGRMIAMSGASWRHGLIAGNFFRELSSQMRGRACHARIADQRVRVNPTGMYTYPDVVALCGEPEFEDAHVDTLLNPTVIVEVLSDSTEAYDRGGKFAHYRRIDSLREYVLVSQSEMRIDYYRRDADQWMLYEVSGPDDVLHLESIDCQVALSRIYEEVKF